MPDPTLPTLTAYHHGNLREALLQAAVQLAEQVGPDNVSVREVAKRVGVSPGAPFRHFSSKTALMTAVAEQAMTRFRAEIRNAVDDVTSGDPLDRFAAVGIAYLRWAIRNPTHFQIISTRNLIDWDSSESLKADNAAIRSLMEGTLVEAQRRGLLRTSDLAEAQIAGRALVYGLARMYIDGHFAQWGVDGETAERTAQNVLTHFISLMGNQQA
jgi:AcrR family transcriptional regulator